MRLSPKCSSISSFQIQKGICDFTKDSRHETVTADEWNNNLLPIAGISLFDSVAVNLDKALFKEYSLELFTQYKDTHNQERFNRFTELTKTKPVQNLKYSSGLEILIFYSNGT